MPPRADIKNLKHQSRDLLAALRQAQAAACQRVREFHPRHRGLSDVALTGVTFTLDDAQLTIAREYGYASWPRLKTVIAGQTGQPATLIHNERIEDVAFRQAVDLLDEGSVAGLETHLERHPDLVHQTVLFEGDITSPGRA